MNRRHWLFGVFPSISDSRRRDTDGSSTGIPQIDWPSRLPVEVTCAARLEKSFRCPIGIVGAEAAGSRIVDSKNPMVINLCSIRLNGRPVQELIRQKGILVRIPCAEVTTVPREMIWQGGRVSPAAQNLGVGQHPLCIDLLRWRRACDLGLPSVLRRVKPEQAPYNDRGGGDEKTPVHYLEVTPSLVGSRSKSHVLAVQDGYSRARMI
jgi:hypothetical protein